MDDILSELHDVLGDGELSPIRSHSVSFTADVDALIQETLASPSANNSAISKLLEEREAALLLREAALVEREAELAQREASLAQREAASSAAPTAQAHRPLFGSADELLGGGQPLCFARDNPEFDARRRESTVALGAAARVVSAIVAAAQKAIDATRRSAAAQQTLGETLMLLQRYARDPSKVAALSQLASLSTLFSFAGQLFSDVGTFREIEANALESAFVAPLLQFQRVPLEQASQYRRRECEAAEAITQALAATNAAPGMLPSDAAVAASVESAVTVLGGFWAALGGGAAAAESTPPATPSRSTAATGVTPRDANADADAAKSVRMEDLRARYEATRYASTKGVEAALSHLRVHSAESVLQAVLVLKQSAEQTRTAAQPLSSACEGLLPVVSAARLSVKHDAAEAEMCARAVATLALSDAIGSTLSSEDVVREARGMDLRAAARRQGPSPSRAAPPAELVALRTGRYLYTMSGGGLGASAAAAGGMNGLLNEVIGQAQSRHQKLNKAWYFVYEGKLWRTTRAEEEGSAPIPSRGSGEYIAMEALGDGYGAVVVVSLLLAAVQASDAEWFEIVHPHEAPGGLRFFAYDRVTARRWVQDLRDCTATLLKSLSGPNEPPTPTGVSSPRSSASSPRGVPPESEGKARRSMLSQEGGAEASVALKKLLALEGNAKCGDCGAHSPRWLIQNSAVLVCISCASVHRSLTVRVSKVSSLLLDAIPLATLDAALAVGGNTRANTVWCGGLSSTGWAPLRPDASDVEREKFITAKYAWRGFVANEEGVGDAESTGSDALLAAVLSGDALATLRCIARPTSLPRDGEGSGGGSDSSSSGRGKEQLKDCMVPVADARVLALLEEDDTVVSRACRTLVLLNKV
jgi:hypothetical protein